VLLGLYLRFETSRVSYVVNFTRIIRVQLYDWHCCLEVGHCSVVFWASEEQVRTVAVWCLFDILQESGVVV